MESKNIVIIGGSSGIGASLARLFAEKGNHVMVTGRREEKLKEISEKYPERILYLKQDVTDLDLSDQVMNTVFSKMGTVDILIYSSGMGEPNYNLTWDKEFPTLQTNVLGAVKIFTFAYQKFKEQGYGHLVGISSVAGIRGNRHVPAYFASKAFQNNYLESLWLKGKRSKAKINVTDIVPGFVDTPMALGKTFWMASPEKAAKQIYNAIIRKKKKAYITKRWGIVALILKFLPSKFLLKL